jgi:hypothetical protein
LWCGECGYQTCLIWMKSYRSDIFSWLSTIKKLRGIRVEEGLNEIVDRTITDSINWNCEQTSKETNFPIIRRFVDVTILSVQ